MKYLCAFAVKFLVFVIVSSNVLGPYNIILRQLTNCENFGTGDIRFSVNFRKINKTDFTVDYNLTLKLPFDDNLLAVYTLEKQTNKAYKKLISDQKVTKPCSASFSMLPTLAKELFTAMKSNGCPLKEGNYYVKGIPVHDYNSKVPAYLRNKYRATCSYLKHGKVVGCMVLVLDVTAKLNQF